MVEKIKFSIENISDVGEDFDDTFSLVSIDAFASGDNERHFFVSEEVLKKYADTIYDKPIVYKIDEWTGNIGGHDKDEQICGYVYRENNPITFRKEEDGRVFLNVKGKIWRKYSSKLLEILKKTDGKKAVSVEMEIPKFDKIKSEIKEFIMRGITIIGTRPAIPLAEMTVLNFSNGAWCFEDKKLMPIDNSKDAAIFSNTWSNIGRKLYQPLIEKSNKLALLKECYLVVDENKLDTAISEAVHYPHHSIKNGKLVVNSKGLQSAFTRARQQGVASGEVLEHIKKHYKELDLDMSNFSANFEEKEDKALEEKVMMEEKAVEVTEPEKEEPKAEMAAEPETAEPKAEMAVEPEKEEQPEDEFGCHGLAEYSAKLKEFSGKILTYETELETLRKFKSDKEEEEKKFLGEKLFSTIGNSLPKDKLDEFRTRFEKLTLPEFASFSNEVKAATYDVVQNVRPEENVVRMSVQKPAQVEKKSVWSF